MQIPVQQPTEDLPERAPSARTSLGIAFGSLAAVIAAVVYVVAVGYLDKHAKAQLAGAVLDPGGAVVAITPPAAPWWPAAAVAVVTGGVFLAAWRSWATATSRRGLVPLWIGTATLLALAVGLTASTAFPFSTIMTTDFNGDAPPEPTLVAWARNGALSPATHALAGVLLVLSFLRPGQRTRRTSASPSPAST